MRVLVLRLEAPLMSFGGVMVDSHGVTDDMPGRSLLVGLCANALGWNRFQSEAHQRLQTRLLHGVRRDRRPEPLLDYQTVDLGADYMAAGWTTRGRVKKRAGGSSTGTHIRSRHFLADGVFTVALTLRHPEVSPTLEQLAAALSEPARPLFVGRKPCIPAGPLVDRIIDANSLFEALRFPPRIRERNGEPPGMLATWPAIDGEPEGDTLAFVCDERDWEAQTHMGERRIWRGSVTQREEAS